MSSGIVVLTTVGKLKPVLFVIIAIMVRIPSFFVIASSSPSPPPCLYHACLSRYPVCHHARYHMTQVFMLPDVFPEGSSDGARCGVGSHWEHSSPYYMDSHDGNYDCCVYFAVIDIWCEIMEVRTNSNFAVVCLFDFSLLFVLPRGCFFFVVFVPSFWVVSRVSFLWSDTVCFRSFFSFFFEFFLLFFYV